MKNVWGWETAKERTEKYARVPAKRKLEALEEMRRFILKVRRSSSRTAVVGSR